MKKFFLLLAAVCLIGGEFVYASGKAVAQRQKRLAAKNIPYRQPKVTPRAPFASGTLDGARRLILRDRAQQAVIAKTQEHDFPACCVCCTTVFFAAGLTVAATALTLL